MIESSPNLLLQKILSQASTQGAVNIHLSCGSLPALRAQGQLVFLESFGIVSPEMVNRFIVELLTPEELERFTHAKQISVSKTLSRETRYRIHAFYQKNLPSLSLHALPLKIPPFEELHLPKPLSGVFRLERGLVVVSGPYGSGKTTVLFGFLEEFNMTTRKRILTIEKPVEYLLENKQSMIQQIEIGRDINSFKEAIISAREEDYNVVYISDLQEESILADLFDLIASGKLVFVEMNALSTVAAIQDLIAQAVRQGISHASDVCADSVEMVLNLRLLPARPSGEVIASEVLIMLPELRTLVREEKFLQIEGVLQTAKRQGLATLDQSIAAFVNEGRVLLSEVLEYARDPAYLKSLIRE